MALSESMAAYEDCYDLFERARVTNKGIRVEILEGADSDERRKFAGLMRMRMNQARVLQRRESMRLYQRDDPRYGKSEYDKFRVTCREGLEENWWVYIEPWNMATGGVESLDDDEPVVEVRV